MAKVLIKQSKLNMYQSSNYTIYKKGLLDSKTCFNILIYI